MRKVLVSVAMASILTISLVASAAIWSGWGPIEQIRESSAGALVSGQFLTINPAGCSDASWGRLDQTLTSTEIDRINKILLSALLSGRDVSVLVDNTSCEGTYIKIVGARIK